eukprot:NODE_2_length_91304_cov_0.692462.p71 type:complete len:140 gc:universal NODE_2_length_91304_cov_0.692462:62275-61856(-)
MFYSIISGILIPQSKDIVGIVQRKICIVGFGNLALSSYMMEAEPSLYAQFVDIIINLTQTGPKTFSTKESDDLADLEETGYDATYAQLKSASNVIIDPVQSISNTKEFTIQVIKKVHELRSNVLAQINSRESLDFLKEL